MQWQQMWPCLHLLVPSVAQGCFISACFSLSITACMILQYLSSCACLCNSSKCYLPTFVSLSFLVLLVACMGLLPRVPSVMNSWKGWGYFQCEAYFWEIYESQESLMRQCLCTVDSANMHTVCLPASCVGFLTMVQLTADTTIIENKQTDPLYFILSRYLDCVH